VKRRTFLLSLGMLACSSPATTTTMPKRKPKPKRKPTMTDIGVRDTLFLESQRQASRLAFHGDTLVQSTGDELRRWNATTMQRTDTWNVPHRHFCIVQDGTIFAFGAPRSVSSDLHRIANGNVELLQLIVPGLGRLVLLPARRADEIYVASGEHVYLVRVTRSAAEVDKILKHPAPFAANRDQWISRGDGRLICADVASVHALDVSNSNEYSTQKRHLIHLAAASGDRIWYSYGTLPEDWNAHTAILAPVDQPMSAAVTLDVAPARFVHIASYGDTLAALLTTVRSLEDITWSVAVFDEKGREHWRADVPSDFALHGALNSAFIAIGPSRVVLASPDGKLLAWDAGSGKPVG
jgi:hypothetical protein